MGHLIDDISNIIIVIIDHHITSHRKYLNDGVPHNRESSSVLLLLAHQARYPVMDGLHVLTLRYLIACQICPPVQKSEIDRHHELDCPDDLYYNLAVGNRYSIVYLF